MVLTVQILIEYEEKCSEALFKLMHATSNKDLQAEECFFTKGQAKLFADGISFWTSGKNVSKETRIFQKHCKVKYEQENVHHSKPL